MTKVVIQRIYLLRHGHIGMQGEKRFIGWQDLPLSPLGIKQALRLQEQFKHIALNKIYCSDLVRSVQTAEIIGARHKIAPEMRTELREISLGEWENRTFQEIALAYPEEFKCRGEAIAHYRTPGGESFADLSRRVIPFMESLIPIKERIFPENILIVGHAGFNRVWLCHILGMPLDKVFKLAQDYGCINLISSSKEGYCVEFLNQAPFGGKY